MPLVANTFSTISLIGIAVNPIVILLANIVVLAGVIALALPFIAPIAEFTTEWQNRIIEWASSLPYGHFDIHISDTAMWSIYALFITGTLLLWLLPKRKKEPKIEG